MRLLAIGFVCSAALIGQVNPILLLHPDYKAMNAKQRLDHYLQQAFVSPVPYLGALAAGGLGQAAKAPPEWGQGAEGFAKRTASGFGLIEIDTAVHNGLSAAMGLEPRYIKCDCQGFLRRTGHAVKMSFLTWDNQGRTRLDLPSMAGAYAGGMFAQCAKAPSSSGSTWAPTLFSNSHRS
jgi:hypothetical protein